MFKLLILICFAVQLYCFAQVTIREEINLSTYSQMSDSVQPIIPFYGRAQVFINRPWSGNCQWPCGYVCFHITAGSQFVDNGCCICDRKKSCFSGSPATINFLNLPKETMVEVTAQKCSLGIWKDVPIYYVKVSDVEYKLWGNLAGSPACNFGFVKFFVQTPLDCPIATENCSMDDNIIPEVKLTPKDKNILKLDPCNKVGVAGYFEKTEHILSNKTTNFIYFNKDSISICFNKQRQIWQISAIEPININYVIGFCPENISNARFEIIENTNQLIERLHDLNYLLNCDIALQSLYGHYKYPIENPLPPPPSFPNTAYFFKEIAEVHENHHLSNYTKFKNDNLPFLMEKVKEFAKFSCNSYSSLDSIKEAMLEKFKMAFTDYQIQLNAEYNKEYALAHGNNQKLIKEKSGHQEKEILDIIKKYKDLIFKECFGI